MSRYIIWDKTKIVITPSGEVFTPEQWIDRYPAAQFIPFVVSGGTVNGAIMQEYTSMIEMYASEGCDFTDCATEQEHLDRIEQFEDNRNREQQEEQERQQREKEEAKLAELLNQTRIADALEDLAVLSMPDMEE